jgi:hypothetical protein
MSHVLAVEDLVFLSFDIHLESSLFPTAPLAFFTFMFHIFSLRNNGLLVVHEKYM